MKNISQVNKKLIDAYQPSASKYYDVEGVLVEKKGKDIVVESNVNDKKIQYKLRLSEEIDNNIGDYIKLESEKILSSKAEDISKSEEEEEVSRSAEAILRDLGLEYSEENLRMVEEMLRSGIKISKSNVESYVKSKNYLEDIVKIDQSQIGKLLDKGIDIENESLESLVESLEAIKSEDKFSIKDFLGIKTKIGYKEAEDIAKKIYGSRMGKDLYDIIISLDEEGIEINRENIDASLEVLKKVYDLRNFKDIDLVEVLNREIDFNIDNLYKIKNKYSLGNLEIDKSARIFEDFSTIGEASVANVKELLVELGLEANNEHIKIFREFLLKDINASSENINKFKAMKEDLGELKSILGSREIVRLQNEEVDILKEDIKDLLNHLKNEQVREEISYVDRELIDSIGDDELLELLKSGRDFNLENIREIVASGLEKDLTIEYKVLDISKNIKSMTSLIGDRLSSSQISRAEELGGLSLSNLAEAKAQLVEDNILHEKHIFIQNEYLKAKNSISTNIVRELIREGQLPETMEIPKLNRYIDKKIDKYREVVRISDTMKEINLNKEEILPLILKNDLELTIAEMRLINSYISGENSIGSLLMKLETSDMKEEGKEQLKKVKREISNSLKMGESPVKPYEELNDFLRDFRDSRDGDQAKGDIDQYENLRRKISRKSNVFQLPVEIGQTIESLNIIFGNGNIDKNNMDFLLNINGKYLGNINMDLKVRGRDIFMDLKEENEGISGHIEDLSERLGAIGYNLIIGDKYEA